MPGKTVHLLSQMAQTCLFYSIKKSAGNINWASLHLFYEEEVLGSGYFYLAQSISDISRNSDTTKMATSAEIAKSTEIATSRKWRH